jgi:predicted DNA-binding transcriptional regulator AlpA
VPFERKDTSCDRYCLKKKSATATKRAATIAAGKARQAQLPTVALTPVADDGDGIRLLSKPEVIERVGVSYATLWHWMRAGTFPRSRALGGKTVWIKSEVEAFMAALPKRLLKGDEEAA